MGNYHILETKYFCSEINRKKCWGRKPLGVLTNSPPEASYGHRYKNICQVVFTVISPCRLLYSMNYVGGKVVSVMRTLARSMLFWKLNCPFIYIPEKSFRSLGNKNEVRCQGGSGLDASPERDGRLRCSDGPGLVSVCSLATAKVAVFTRPLQPSFAQEILGSGSSRSFNRDPCDPQRTF